MPLTTSELSARFLAEARALGAVQAENVVFTELCTGYGEDARKYHSLQHIAECLVLFEDVRGTLAAPAEVAMAIWFHDAVYATHPFAASEKKSAALAEASCKRMGISEAVARRIAAMVRATEHHELPGESGVNVEDARTFFDIDLAILGADPVRYAEFERDVRTEFSWVPDHFFRSGRAKLLEGFAARTAIFHHAVLRERFEERARRNIARAVVELRSSDDQLLLHATDEHLFATRAARLEEIHPWENLYSASVYPAPFGRPSLILLVSFAQIADPNLSVDLAAPHADEILERLRSIVSYDHDAERRAERDRVPVSVYNRERQPAVVGPLRRAASSAYRGRP